MTVKLTTGDVLDLDDLPSLTVWLRQHIEVTAAHFVDYDDGTGLFLGAVLTGVSDAYAQDRDNVFDLAVYADLAEDPADIQTERARP